MLERTNDCLVKGDYGASIVGLKLCLELAKDDSSATIKLTFAIDVLETVSHPGDLFSMTTRTFDIMSRFVLREREKHRHVDPSEWERLNLKRTLMRLNRLSDFLVGIFLRQELIQMWETVLGREDSRIVALYDTLCGKRISLADLDPNHNMADAENGITDPYPQLRNELDADIPPFIRINQRASDRFMIEIRLPKCAPDQEIQREGRLLCHGRSRALEGVHFSCHGRYADADLAFQDSDQLLEHETSVEIHLYRILWDAEHRTRVGDWAGVGGLICRAHQVYMDNEHPSAFVLHHFPSRFEVLCAAASRRVPVEELDKDRARPYKSLGSAPASPRVAEEAEEEVSVLSPKGSFPGLQVGGVPRSTSLPGMSL